MMFMRGLAKFIIRLLDRLVDFCVLILVVAMLLVGGYSIWDTNQVYSAAEAAQYAAYIPVEGDTSSYEELVQINPEVIGWLRVNDTHINYPLLQAKDNSKYVHTTVDGSYSLSGAIFLDCTAAPDFSDFNSVIYGHHMEKNKMFGDLGLFTDKEYFDAHPYGDLYFGGKNHGIEFFAFLLVDAYDDIFARRQDEPELWQAYLDQIQALALYSRDIPVTTEDRLVLLSTCTNEMTNGRHILVGRLTDTVYPVVEPPKFFGLGVDTLGGDHLVPNWLLYLGYGIVLLILLILIVKLVIFIRRKKRGGRYARKKNSR